MFVTLFNDEADTIKMQDEVVVILFVGPHDRAKRSSLTSVGFSLHRFEIYSYELARSHPI
jgi:hypothetical protein